MKNLSMQGLLFVALMATAQLNAHAEQLSIRFQERQCLGQQLREDTSVRELVAIFRLPRVRLATDCTNWSLLTKNAKLAAAKVLPELLKSEKKDRIQDVLFLLKRLDGEGEQAMPYLWAHVIDETLWHGERAEALSAWIQLAEKAHLAIGEPLLTLLDSSANAPYLARNILIKLDSNGTKPSRLLPILRKCLHDLATETYVADDELDQHYALLAVYVKLEEPKAAAPFLFELYEIDLGRFRSHIHQYLGPMWDTVPEMELLALHALEKPASSDLAQLLFLSHSTTPIRSAQVAMAFFDYSRTRKDNELWYKIRRAHRDDALIKAQLLSQLAEPALAAMAANQIVVYGISIPQAQPLLVNAFLARVGSADSAADDFAKADLARAITQSGPMSPETVRNIQGAFTEAVDRERHAPKLGSKTPEYCGIAEILPAQSGMPGFEHAVIDAALSMRTRSPGKCTRNLSYALAVMGSSRSLKTLLGLLIAEPTQGALDGIHENLLTAAPSSFAGTISAMIKRERGIRRARLEELLYSYPGPAACSLAQAYANAIFPELKKTLFAHPPRYSSGARLRLDVHRMSQLAPYIADSHTILVQLLLSRNSDVREEVAQSLLARLISDDEHCAVIKKNQYMAEVNKELKRLRPAVYSEATREFDTLLSFIAPHQVTITGRISRISTLVPTSD